MVFAQSKILNLTRNVEIHVLRAKTLSNLSYLRGAMRASRVVCLVVRLGWANIVECRRAPTVCAPARVRNVARSRSTSVAHFLPTFLVPR